MLRMSDDDAYECDDYAVVNGAITACLGIGWVASLHSHMSARCLLQGRLAWRLTCVVTAATRNQRVTPLYWQGTTDLPVYSFTRYLPGSLDQYRVHTIKPK